MNVGLDDLNVAELRWVARMWAVEESYDRASMIESIRAKFVAANGKLTLGTQPEQNELF